MVGRDGWGPWGKRLINLGPRADGSIPEEQSAPLRALGAWIADHRPAIYGTRPSRDLGPQPAGSTAVKFVESGGRRFALLIGDMPTGEHRLMVGPRVHGVRTSSGRPLLAERAADALVVTFPPAHLSPPVGVLELV